MRSARAIIVVAVLSCTLTAAAAPPPGEEWVTARGLGTTKGTPTPAKAAIAREKARIRAERDLLGVVHQLRIDAETTMEETMQDSSYHEVIVKQVRGSLRGAKILSERTPEPGTCEIELGIPVDQLRMAVLVRPNRADTPLPPVIIPSRNFAPTGTFAGTTAVRTMVTDTAPGAVTVTDTVDDEPTEPTTAEGTTSLVVDARHLAVAERAFWPRVLAPDGRVVYGDYDPSADFLQTQAPVVYVTAMSAALANDRAGSRPLIVKAESTAGRYHADLVLATEDAEQILARSASDGFLRAYRVIVILAK